MRSTQLEESRKNLDMNVRNPKGKFCQIAPKGRGGTIKLICQEFNEIC